MLHCFHVKFMLHQAGTDISTCVISLTLDHHNQHTAAATVASGGPLQPVAQVAPALANLPSWYTAVHAAVLCVTQGHCICMLHFHVAIYCFTFTTILRRCAMLRGYVALQLLYCSSCPILLSKCNLGIAVQQLPGRHRNVTAIHSQGLMHKRKTHTV